MLPVKPTPIPMPFAQNGNKNDIPEQSPGASEPNASWSAGFPPITMYPREAGGLPPMGQDFNGILNALSQQAFWRQSGGMAEWSADLDYPVPALVVGSDGKYYTSLQASGPSGAGAKDPTDAENSAWWAQAMLNGSDDVFTPPTNSEPGKQGLVPAPDMSAEAAARCVLGADAHWHEFDDTVAMNEGKYGVPALEGGIKFCTFRNFGLTNGSSSNYKSPTFSGSNIEIMGGNPVHVSQVNSARLVADEPGLYFISFRGDIIWSGSNTYTGSTQIIIRKSESHGTIVNTINSTYVCVVNYGAQVVIANVEGMLPLSAGQTIEFQVYDATVTGFTENSRVRLLKILSMNNNEAGEAALLFDILNDISEERQLAMAKWNAQQQIDAAIAATNAELTQVSADLLAAMLAPAAMDVEDGAAVISVEDGRRKLLELRAVQADNHALRKLALAAETVDEIESIVPVTADSAAQEIPGLSE